MCYKELINYWERLVQLKIQLYSSHLQNTRMAEDFEKEHKTVLRNIDNLLDEIGVAQNCADLFIPTEYQHEQNKQLYKEYLLTRDGFSLLVMGFTGAKALKWKLKYIEAFNKMEEEKEEKEEAPPQELINIRKTEDGGNVVSAKELYLGLGLNEAVWSRWYKSNVESNEFFSENKDWISFQGNAENPNGGRPTVDFAITIEFAKHIAMMARTVKSHEYRNYFIKCEEALKAQLKSQPKLPTTFAEVLIR